ncbi:hypothetical protein E4P41_03245 [Geodermatophilus sp. DF01-2]|uniref:hypothetical protein n=1 Tax=Geodermatophilus sp. DF01-2 TaxID=2559610 RepID=UPI0010743E9F|nr:hypothetical protein [Geodermatophilus sp. DF01_2]TFV63991.1 hypothetical protein E4P41_03245 [Geodermatophilus sp. DF01_2]
MTTNRAQINYRAIRNMGLAAWWGSSLMGLGSLLRGVGGAIDDPVERARVVDAGWKASRGLIAGSVTAYVVGTGMVRYDGKPLQNGVPRWLTDGPESPLRAFLTATALGAAVAARTVREKGDRMLQQGGQTSGTAGQVTAGGQAGTSTQVSPQTLEQAQRMDRIGHALHVAVPAATGWLMYSHLKQDMRETSGVRSVFRR